MISAADALKQMIDLGLEAANYWELRYEIAEPKHDPYDILGGGFPNEDYSTFFRPASQHFMHLMQEHFGEWKLAAEQATPVESFDAPLYGREMPARNDVPYLSTLASGSEWTELPSDRCGGGTSLTTWRLPTWTPYRTTYL